MSLDLHAVVDMARERITCGDVGLIATHWMGKEEQCADGCFE